MISIIPDQASAWRPVTPALRRLFQRVKRLPFEGARAWLAFPRNESDTVTPDFLILDGSNRAFLLTAGDISTHQAEEILQPGLFEVAMDNQSIAKSLRRAAGALGDFAANITGSTIPRFLIFPSLTDSASLALADRLAFPANIVAKGEPESLAELLLQHAAAPLEIDASHALQAAFSVESRVPPAFVPRHKTRLTYSDSGRDPCHTGYLLDFAQESWVKHDLVPGEEALSAIHGTPARLITGVAGSGKSLVLLYRARLQSQLATNRSSRILFVTHNKPLIGELSSRFHRLASIIPVAHEDEIPVDFLHFFRWCGMLHFEEKLTLLRTQERRLRIAQLAREVFPDRKLPESFYIEEIGFISDQIDDSEPAYLGIDRAGRGIALDRGERRKMHALYRRYRGSLAANRETDWQFIVRIVWEKIKAGQLPLPRYDFIFVDEAQFFAPIWFAILKACLSSNTGEFVVAADPTQGFLKRRLSWRSVGLNVIGRSARLSRSYRNIPAIQAFARRFYESRIHASEHFAEETVLPDGKLPEDTNNDPRLIKHRAPQDGILWAANEVAAALAEGLPPAAILVLIENRRALESLHNTLVEKIGSARVATLTHAPPADAGAAVSLSTINSATGIERPVVILLGLDALFEQEEDPRLDRRQRTEIVRDNTRKIYMALTRAGEKLLISYRNDRTRSILEGNSITQSAGDTPLDTHRP